LEKLKAQLDTLMGRLERPDQLRAALVDLTSVYPFNEYEFIISHLLAADKLTLQEYLELRDGYIYRNLYLYLFEISAPRGFGEVWAHAHLKELVPALSPPSRKLDPEYRGQYDFFLPPEIKIEVKASRAVQFNTDEPLYIKALPSDSTKRFDMNFQQIKPACCDVFVWMAAWRDVIKYWVMASSEVEKHPSYSKGQHRGNVGEGQLHLNEQNIRSFDRFLVEPKALERALREAYKRQTKTAPKNKRTLFRSAPRHD
jgi:hypothetical protein